jgi:hypothetical protein
MCGNLPNGRLGLPHNRSAILLSQQGSAGDEPCGKPAPVPNRPGISGQQGHRSTKWGEWSRHSDLNRGPAVYETAALPLSYVGADQE